MPLIRKNPGGPPTTGGDDVGALILMLQGGTADERWSAARRLGDYADAGGALAAALAAETDLRVREAIFTSLARLPAGGGAQAVAQYLRSEDASLRTGALDALRSMGEPAGVLVPGLLRDPDPDVRGLACDLTRQLPTKAAIALLCDRLDSDPEVNVCAAAVDVLAEIGDRSAIPALTRCAARFGAEPFLDFAIRFVLDGIAAQDPGPA
jgi:HEAT repeat protein